jgi:acetyl esterase/lipase
MNYISKSIMLLHTVILAGILILTACHSPEPTEGPVKSPTDLRRFVPTTVSEGWQDVYAKLPDPTQMATLPGPDDIAAWGKVHSTIEEAQEANIQRIIQQYALNVDSMDFGGIPVLQVTSGDWQNNGKVLIYIHGGAYSMFSARTSLGSSGPVAEYTRLRVIAIDYTNPPRARWQEVTDQVVTVFKELIKQGYAMEDIGLYGDSAGGGMAAGSVLKLRDAGLGTPSAVVLWSPWADITETGDTYQTLKDADPNFIYEKILGPSADAYADKKDQIHPYVSPVYGDFTKGFPPTLIQGGTREIFLSNFVRLYQALDTSGQTVNLDLYEGMPHVFQLKLPESPESLTALKKMNSFLLT